MIKKWTKSELVQKMVFTLFLLGIMELGREIALPGLDKEAVAATLRSTYFLQALSMATGGQVNQLTLFSVGLGPYMTGMILFQAIQMLDIGSLKNLSSRQIGFVQRFIALIIAIIQSIQMTILIKSHILKSGATFLGMNTNIIMLFMSLLTGAMIVSWLSDMTVVKGMGGSGILIFPGLVNSIPRLLGRGQGMGSGTFEFTATNLLIFAMALIVVTLLAIYMNRAELRLPLQRPMIDSDFSESYLPMRVLTSGSMPFMFATSVFMIPSYMLSFGVSGSTAHFIQKYFVFDNWVGIGIYCGVVFFLTYAFSFMNIQPEDRAKSLKESGDYFLGITPGDETYHFLEAHMLRLSTVAGIFFVIIIGVPLILGMYFEGIGNFAFVFSNVIILMSVMETLTDQVQVMYLRTRYNLLDAQ